jgi:hypothetical protein
MTTKRNRDNEPTSYRWFDYIAIRGPVDFLLPSLELFLLSKFRTADNRQHSERTSPMFSGPCVFDEEAEDTDQNRIARDRFMAWLNR